MAKKFAVKRAPKEFTLNEPLTFGKCKGALLVEVIEDDPTYIRWCLDNIGWFKIDKEAEAKLMMEEDHAYVPEMYDGEYRWGGLDEPF